MVEILEEKTHDNVIALKVKGKIDKNDYDKILPLIDLMVKRHNKLNGYAEVHELDGITAKAIWEEIKADIKYLNNFNKVAVVGDATWKEKLTKAADIIPSIESRYFDFNQKDQAIDWVNKN